MNTSLEFTNEQDNKTLESILRTKLPGQSWNQIRRLVEARKVMIDGVLCIESARRISKGKRIEILEHSAPKPKEREVFPIRYLDPHLVVVEKPSGISTVHHPAELEAKEEPEPSLLEIMPPLIAKREGKPRGQLRVVQRLDKETSGLVVFARTIQAERELGEQFLAHTVKRRYFAVVPGEVSSQTITTWMVRDRGDGRRGNSPTEGVGKKAVTHVTRLEWVNGYSLLSCVLETGRTHQIRIHLAGIGHPLCGDKVYNKYYNTVTHPDESGAPRLALHALELGFVHPDTRQDMFWEMSIPEDLERFVNRLRKRTAKPA